MKKPAIPPNEGSRLKALHSLNVLDTLAEDRFDRLTRMAKAMFDVPIALVSLVDENRQWFKSCIGINNASETSRATATARSSRNSSPSTKPAGAASTTRFSRFTHGA